MKLRVMTFNLRVNVSSDGDNAWPYRKDQAADTIKQFKPMIIGTQEGRYGMLEELDALLPEYSRIGEGRAGYITGDEGLDECCAIYYDRERLTLLEQGQFWLSETPDQVSGRAWDADYPRFCTWGRFQLNDDRDFQLYMFNTHFDHVGQQAREQSAALILGKIAEITNSMGLPFILTGDLNCNPEDPAIRTLAAELNNAFDALEQPEQERLTFHDYRGGAQGEPIDYIFTSRQAAIENTTIYRGSRDGRYPSDHYPVVAELTF